MDKPQLRSYGRPVEENTGHGVLFSGTPAKAEDHGQRGVKTQAPILYLNMYQL